MTEHTTTGAPELAQEHAAEVHAPYMKVWAALAVFTAVEYFYAFIFKDLFLILLLGLLLWAAIKAGLVGWFFMHLKFEGPWVYMLIIPAFVLAAVLVLACTPDMAMKPEPPEESAEQTSWVAPVGQAFQPDTLVVQALQPDVIGRSSFPA